MKKVAWTLAVAAGLAAGSGLRAEDRKEPITDEDFVSKAAVAGSFEVFTSKMAVKRGVRADVKKFAQQMILDHEKANQELLSIAGQKQYKVPKVFDAKHQKCVDKLEKLQGAEFDTDYVKEQVKAHKEAVELFEAASKDLRDADLKAFASKTLPTLREHYQMIQNIEKGKSDGDHAADAAPAETKSPK